jgi:hypothetical protein
LLHTIEVVFQQSAAAVARGQLRDGSQQLAVDSNPVPDIPRMQALRILAG